MDTTKQKYDPNNPEPGYTKNNFGQYVPSANTSVTGAKLAPVVPVVLPETSPVITPVNPAVDATVADQKTASEKARIEAQATAKTGLSQTLKDLMQTNVDISNVAGSVDRTAEDLKRQEADKYTTQIEAEQLAARRQIEDIQRNNPTGALRGGQLDLVNNIQRESLSKQADLAMLQNAASRDYERLSSIADRQVTLKLEPLKVKAENLKLYYEANKADFNKEDDRLYSEAVKKADNIYQKQQDLEKSIAAIKVEAVKNGLTDLSGFDKAESIDDALRLAKGYMSDPLAKAIQAMQYKKLVAETNKIITETATEAAKNSPATASAAKVGARDTAKALFTKVIQGKGFEGAVGAKGVSSLFGLKGTPISGTEAADFVNLYDNFKALLSLDNIKLMKGQGQISDGERKTLEQASSKLNRATTEEEFKTILVESLGALGATPEELLTIDPNYVLRTQLKSGEVLVKDKFTGEIGAISGYINPGRWEKL